MEEPSTEYISVEFKPERSNININQIAAQEAITSLQQIDPGSFYIHEEEKNREY